jgi:glycosyltransferase involved in cell wall biosynthesis
MSLSVLHVAQPTDGGVARCVLDLVGDQVSRGWEVVLASPGHGDLAGGAEALGAGHAKWEAARQPGPAAVSEARALARVIGSLGPDLVHLHSSKAGLAGRLALRGGRPTVFQPHAWSFEAVRGVVRLGAIAWERLAARWTHAIVCVSEAERGQGARAGIRAPYRVIPNGVDLVAWSPATGEERAAARRRLDLEDGPLAVCVGRLSEQKGQDVLVEAWPTVAERVPSARLVLVGGGPEEDRLRSLAGPGIDLVGPRNDAGDWYAAADVVVAPSRWEGMSLVLLEAMASARSVVATDVPGAREALGGEAGEIVPVGDAHRLAEALVERLLDPGRAAAEGTAGRRQAESAHDLRTATGAMAELYEALLSSSTGPTTP